MAKHADSELTWFEKPFGRRLSSPDHPFFTICRPADHDDDVRRRNDLAGLAGL